MRSLRSALILACALAAGATLAPSALAAASRTWVSGVGDDANPCSRTAPCKTFAGAISKTAENGEIDVLDPGGMGTITITKAITIDGNGVGSILSASTNGIVVNAEPNAAVVLRDLTINGGPISDPAPATGCPYAGLNGIRILSAGSVRLDNVTIQNTQQAGISVAPAGTAPQVVLDGVTVQSSCATGVDVAPTGTGSANVLLRNTSISNTVTGLHVGTGGVAWLTGSSIFDNTTGLLTDGGGIINAIDQNQVVGNGTNGTPTSTSTSAPPQVVTTPGPTQVVTTPAQVITTPAQVVTVQTPAPVRCIVPTLTGLTVAQATAKLKKANCMPGRLSMTPTTPRRVGKVIRQKTEAGVTAPAGTKVSLTVGKKKVAKQRSARGR